MAKGSDWGPEGNGFEPLATPTIFALGLPQNLNNDSHPGSNEASVIVYFARNSN